MTHQDKTDVLYFEYGMLPAVLVCAKGQKPTPYNSHLWLPDLNSKLFVQKDDQIQELLMGGDTVQLKGLGEFKTVCQDMDLPLPHPASFIVKDATNDQTHTGFNSAAAGQDFTTGKPTKRCRGLRVNENTISIALPIRPIVK